MNMSVRGMKAREITSKQRLTCVFGHQRQQNMKRTWHRANTAAEALEIHLSRCLLAEDDLALVCQVCCRTHLPDIGCEGRGDLMARAVCVDIILNAIFLRSTFAPAQHDPLQQIRCRLLLGS